MKIKLQLKLSFDNDFFFGIPTAYRSPTFKGFEWTILWLWFSIRVEGSRK